MICFLKGVCPGKQIGHFLGGVPVGFLLFFHFNFGFFHPALGGFHLSLVLGHLHIAVIVSDYQTIDSGQYAKIFWELYNGNDRPLNIAKAIGVGKSQVYTDKKHVQELAQELYRKMIGQE